MDFEPLCFQAIVPKLKSEVIGIVIVESGWGSMVPTVVLANMMPNGPAARCGQLNIGDQIISINGVSLVGLPLSTCQSYIKVGAHSSVSEATFDLMNQEIALHFSNITCKYKKIYMSHFFNWRNRCRTRSR